MDTLCFVDNLLAVNNNFMSYTSVNTPSKSMLHIAFTLLWCVGYVCLSAIDINALPTEAYAQRRQIQLSSTPPADTVYFTLTTQVVGHATNFIAKPVEKNEGIAKTMYCRAIRQDGKIEYRYASLLLSDGARYLNMYRFLVYSDTLSIDDAQYRGTLDNFDDELFILR